MILPSVGAAHLTYCTNIHPGESWPEIRSNLERFVLAVKAKVAPLQRFGVGLRLSDAAARSLSKRDELDRFRAFLDTNGLYVFTINGFPYGRFHGAPVKETVYLPDWKDDERRTYTDRLAHLLACLLPEDCPRLEGSVSTVPGAFKARVRSSEDMTRIAAQMVEHAVELHCIHEATGRIISLAIEPEPCCMLETVAETTAFFHNHLFAASAVDRFRKRTGLGRVSSEEALRRHLGVCLDLCHAAVEFEDPDEAVSALRGAGIRIAKLQLSAGLRISKLADADLDALAAFAEGVYLHQVVERQAGRLVRYVDLPQALRAAASRKPGDDSEWRIHFHVPIFMKQLGSFENTQDFVGRILRLQVEDPISAHLELETYTWDVLPEEYRSTDVVNAVVRELRWVTERVAR